jgi:CDP-diacylglycerol---serine O-phosphatidyltransferase
VPRVPRVARAPRPPSRETLQRGVIILPSAFTLGNLFFGIYAMVAAFIMFALFFSDTQWSWVLSYVYVTAAVVRLARFNIEQGGEAKRYYHGLPSPAAGLTLASFFPFSQTPFFEAYLGDLPWQQILGIGMVLLAILLVSHVPYAKFPKIGLRTPKGIANTIVVLGALFLALTVPRYFFFSASLFYLAWGLVNSVLLGLLDRLPGGDPLLDEDENELDARAEVRSLDYGELGPRGPASVPPDQDIRLEDNA